MLLNMAMMSEHRAATSQWGLCEDMQQQLLTLLPFQKGQSSQAKPSQAIKKCMAFCSSFVWLIGLPAWGYRGLRVMIAPREVAASIPVPSMVRAGEPEYAAEPARLRGEPSGWLAHCSVTWQTLMVRTSCRLSFHEKGEGGGGVWCVHRMWPQIQAKEGQHCAQAVAPAYGR